jgi:signal transduction histidine kinase
MIDTLLTAANMTLLALGGGLSFVWVLQAEPNWRWRLMLSLWGMLAVWGALAVAQQITSQPGLNDWIIGVAVVLVAIYYIIVIDTTQRQGWLRYLVGGVILIGGVTVYLVVTDQLYDANTKQLTWVGYGVIASMILATALAFWTVIDSSIASLTQWRLPTFFILLAGVILLIPHEIAFVISRFLTVAGVTGIGWVSLHRKLVSPINTLKDELEVANGDLKRALNELARVKNRLDSVQKDLQEAKEQKTNFLATMSHELRTPLNSIVGYSELLTNGIYGDLNEQQTDRLQKIHRNGQNLQRVIDDILDLSKIEAGRLELNLQHLDMEKTVQPILSDFQQRSTTRGLVFELAIEPNLITIIGDSHRIQQIIGNLLDNAIKFTPQGSVRLGIINLTVDKGQSTDFKLPMVGWVSDGHWVLIDITDTGIGIPHEDQAAIFDEFSQVDPSPSREFEGTGLGLTITRKLVELHHGIIWVRSQPGAGSSFYVILPSVRTFNAMRDGYRDILGVPL